VLPHAGHLDRQGADDAAAHADAVGAAEQTDEKDREKTGVRHDVD
jgi:hypothetical protein